MKILLKIFAKTQKYCLVEDFGVAEFQSNLSQLIYIKRTLDTSMPGKDNYIEEPKCEMVGVRAKE
jgi:hypothetical protein